MKTSRARNQEPWWLYQPKYFIFWGMVWEIYQESRVNNDDLESERFSIKEQLLAVKWGLA